MFEVAGKEFENAGEVSAYIRGMMDAAGILIDSRRIYLLNGDCYQALTIAEGNIVKVALYISDKELERRVAEAPVS